MFFRKKILVQKILLHFSAGHTSLEADYQKANNVQHNLSVWSTNSTISKLCTRTVKPGNTIWESELLQLTIVAIPGILIYMYEFCIIYMVPQTCRFQVDWMHIIKFDMINHETEKLLLIFNQMSFFSKYGYLMYINRSDQNVEFWLMSSR